jgi:hypothetical protein
MRSSPGISRFRPGFAPCWPPPRIVADALAAVPDPLETVLVPGPAAPADAVCRALIASLAPAESAADPPDWLYRDQVPQFQRVLVALDRYGGALLADPVGSGKTWIALAVAHTLAPAGGAVAIVPAALMAQWEATARRIGIPLALASHEAVSRGRLPRSRSPLVLVDEAHRFRNPAALRYPHLARWLVGRRALLLSATPVVNRIEDLAHQLLLTIRDDALAPRGCPSLLGALRRGVAPPALGELVLCRALPSGAPVAHRRTVTLPLTRTEREMLTALERLRLSNDGGLAALVRVVFWRALASSPGAFAAALGRYRRLLDHARAANRPVTRAAIHRFTGVDPEQLLLWELLPDLGGTAELCLGDSARLVELEAQARRQAESIDARSAVLRAVLGDRTATIVFTTSRDTLGWLRARLADLRPAWVTGDGAGIGRAHLGRGEVLSHFRPNGKDDGATPGAPAILLATDVAAEGLDLQRAERIVHYDLPWTSVRLDQRAGRALRLGAVRDSVEILEFAPAAELDARLGALSRLGAKRNLGTRAGIDERGRWLYRWRSDLAAETDAGPAVHGMAVVHGDDPGWLVGLAIDLSRREGGIERAPAALLWIGEDGGVTDDPATCVARLEAIRGQPGIPPTAADRVAAVQRLAPVVRTRLRDAHGDQWRVEAADGRRRLTRRLRRMAAEAARERHRPRLTLASQALEWLTGGLTAGELALADALASTSERDLLADLPRLMARPRNPGVPLPRLTGIVRVTSFPACQPSALCSSISTAL